MCARVLSSRALLLCTVAVLVAAGLVLLGAGSTKLADAAVAPGTTQLVSTGAPTSQGSGQAAISADGRYVAFATLTSYDPRDNAREGDSNLDVYVRDLREQKTVLLSHGVAPPSGQLLDIAGLLEVSLAGDSRSGNPSISADGRYVAFETTATNLGPQDRDRHTDVVVVDRDPDGDGVFDETECPQPRLYCHEFTRVSPDEFDERNRLVAGATAPSISATGDSVAWVGVPVADPPSYDPAASNYSGVPVVYRSILQKGPTGAVTSVRSHQVNAAVTDLLVQGATAPALSADARRLVMVAGISPPAGGASTGSAVLGMDLPAGPLAETDNEVFPAIRFDIDENGAVLPLPPNFTAAPTLSGDGGLVAFSAPQGANSLAVRTAAWGPAPRSMVASTNISGAPVHGSDPALSANGRYLAYTTSARNTHNGVDGPRTECDPDRRLGLGISIEVAAGIDIDPSLDIDAEVDVDAEVDLNLGFTDPPPTLPAPDPGAPSYCDVVVRDLVVDQARAAAGLPQLPAELASPSLARNCVAALPADGTCEGDEASGYPVLSADGSVVAYESQAATLVTGDSNGHVQDIFARTFQPTLVADPIDFFTVEPGSSTRGSTTLRHGGFGPLRVESMTIGGVHRADFTVFAETCLGQVVQTGESCRVSVRFAPSELGSRQAELQVRHSGPASPLVVPLLGLAEVPAPQALTLAPNPLSFGPTAPLSPSPPGTVTMTNTGAAALTVDAVSLPTDAGPGNFPEDYAITADTCTSRTVRPGESCTVTLQYSPRGVGARPAVLRFDDNAPNAPHLVTLEGVGTQPLLQFNPAVVQVGRTTTIFGSKFPAQRNVTIRIPEVASPITVTTDPAGNFSSPVVIFPNATQGTRIAEATIEGSQPPITATASLLVVPGTAAPPDFRNRR